jgi:hypothetical protein
MLVNTYPHTNPTMLKEGGEKENRFGKSIYK